MNIPKIPYFIFIFSSFQLTILVALITQVKTTAENIDQIENQNQTMEKNTAKIEGQEIEGLIKKIGILEKEIETTKSEQEKIKKDIENSQKDIWDKLSIISTFVSSVILVMIGGIFTFLFQWKEIKRQTDESVKQLATKKETIRLQELEAIIKLLPLLSSKDEKQQEMAILSMKILASTKVAIEFASFISSQGTNEAVAKIANISEDSDEDYKLAENELNTIFNKYLSAVVLIFPEEKSDDKRNNKNSFCAFYITNDGYLISAYKSIVNQTNTSYKVLNIDDGQEYNAKLIASNKELQISVFKIEESVLYSIPISKNKPFENTQILFMGLTNENTIRVSSIGKIYKLDSRDLWYERNPKNNYRGTTGSPVLNTKGEVVGVHQAAVLGKKNQGWASRVDTTIKYLNTELNISI
ncbi:MAG: serine protease [Crocosphaera sp.]|nr:serine protease [Crocosphaera sp.]